MSAESKLRVLVETAEQRYLRASHDTEECRVAGAELACYRNALEIVAAEAGKVKQKKERKKILGIF